MVVCVIAESHGLASANGFALTKDTERRSRVPKRTHLLDLGFDWGVERMDFHPSMVIIENIGFGHGDVLMRAWYRNVVGLVLTRLNRVLLINRGHAYDLRQQITLVIVVIQAVGQAGVL